MARQSERREATRGALIAAARRCFLERGYEAASTEAVLAQAGVSKGALYHHFDSKTDLLAAVFEDVSRELTERAVAATAGAPSFRAALALGLKAWLRAVMEPEALRIVLETGPAALGLARARALEDAVTQAPLRLTLQRAVVQGETSPLDDGLTARLLSATVGELALVAAERRLSGPDLEPLDRRIDALIDALVPPAEPAAACLPTEAEL